MKQSFVMIPIYKTLHLESHFLAFGLPLKLLSGSRLQSLRDASNELLNTHKIS